MNNSFPCSPPKTYQIIKRFNVMSLKSKMCLVEEGRPKWSCHDPIMLTFSKAHKSVHLNQEGFFSHMLFEIKYN